MELEVINASPLPHRARVLGTELTHRVEMRERVMDLAILQVRLGDIPQSNRVVGVSSKPSAERGQVDIPSK